MHCAALGVNMVRPLTFEAERCGFVDDASDIADTGVQAGRPQ
jgi:hypothetical protein